MRFPSLVSGQYGGHCFFTALSTVAGALALLLRLNTHSELVYRNEIATVFIRDHDMQLDSVDKVPGEGAAMDQKLFYNNHAMRVTGRDMR
jgi:hypothetical protein